MKSKNLQDAPPQNENIMTVNSLVGQLDRMMPSVLASLSGMQFKAHRDLYTIFGWERQLTAILCSALYATHGIAIVANDVPIDTTWRNDPKITSNSAEFDKKIKLLNNRINLFGKLHDVDRISGIGRYGIMILGIAGQEYKNKLENFKLDELQKIDVYQESEVNLEIEQKKSEDKVTAHYSIRYYNIAGEKIHPSRVIHIAEKSLDGIFGRSRLIPIYNQLQDMWKVSGSTAEQFYMSASLLLSAQGREGYKIDETDGTKLQEKLLELVNRFKGFLVSNGFDIKNISPKIVSPKDSWEVQKEFICASRRIPKRILFGSEAGQLASTQDQANYYEQIEARQTNYVSKKVISPLIELLIAYSDLNSTTYEILWDKLSSLTEKEVAESCNQYADTLKKLAEAGVTDADIVQVTLDKMKKIIKT